MLIAGLIVLVSAPLLEVRPQGKVGIRGWSAFVLPPTCFARDALGIDCPGCGLTRSFVHLAHGDWSSSLKCHRIGWLLMLAVLLQIPYRIHALRNSDKALLSPRTSSWIGTGLIALLLGNWLLGYAIPRLFRI
jgi:hypothetical protein